MSSWPDDSEQRILSVHVRSTRARRFGGSAGATIAGFVLSCLAIALTFAAALSTVSAAPARVATAALHPIACGADHHASVDVTTSTRGDAPRKAHHKCKVRESAERDPAPAALIDVPRVQLAAVATRHPVVPSLFPSSTTFRNLAPRAPPVITPAS
jgi:hypothetical protein